MLTAKVKYSSDIEKTDEGQSGFVVTSCDTALVRERTELTFDAVAIAVAATTRKLRDTSV